MNKRADRNFERIDNMAQDITDKMTIKDIIKKIEKVINMVKAK